MPLLSIHANVYMILAEGPITQTHIHTTSPNYMRICLLAMVVAVAVNAIDVLLCIFPLIHGNPMERANGASCRVVYMCIQMRRSSIRTHSHSLTLKHFPPLDCRAFWRRQPKMPMWLHHMHDSILLLLFY